MNVQKKRRPGTLSRPADSVYSRRANRIIYLRDGIAKEGSNPAELLDVCDQNTIPYATNIASAEILITAVDAGSLDYREWTNSEYSEGAI